MNKEKMIKESKELIDLQNEIQKTQKLLAERNWQELEKHLADIMSKYPAETAMHNSVNPVMPRSIQENAINCINFLNQLIKGKSAQNIYDELKENK